jgi:hypothetical protein
MKAKVLIGMLFFLVQNVGCSQSEKGIAKFARIDIANYLVESNGKINVDFYITIDQKGNIEILDRRGEISKSYRYMITDSIIGDLNSIFSGKTPLRKQVQVTKMAKNEFYGGNYRFIRYTAVNGVKDSVITIPAFNSKLLEDVLTHLILTFDVNQNQTPDPVNLPYGLINAIDSSHKKAGYLPQVVLPPLQREEE